MEEIKTHFKNYTVFLADSFTDLYSINEQKTKDLISDSKKELMIFFKKDIINEFDFSKTVKIKDYRFDFIYSLDRKQLDTKEISLPQTLKEHYFENYESFKDFTQIKLKEYCADFPEYLSIEDANYFMQIFTILTSMENIRYFAISKDNDIVAYSFFMPGNDAETKEATPADWVSFVWISKDKITTLERAIIHKYFMGWVLKESIYGRINASVQHFNIRSQKFFKNMGFKFKCVIVSSQN